MLTGLVTARGKLLFLACGLVATVVCKAFAGERVDFFNTEGRRTGHAIVDSNTGRVDFYDVNARRTGWGRLQPSGTVERFDLTGRRQPETAVPLAGEKGR